MGNPNSAAKYFEMAQDTIKDSMKDASLSAEMKKELLES